MKSKVTEVANTSFEIVSSKAASISLSVGEAGKNVGEVVGNIATTTVELVGDLNGDGKVDVEDTKIALTKVKQVASSVVDETAILSKKVIRSDLVNDVAPFAAIGALIAVPIPLVGPAIGAAMGAALGLYKNATKKK